MLSISFDTQGTGASSDVGDCHSRAQTTSFFPLTVINSKKRSVMSRSVLEMFFFCQKSATYILKNIPTMLTGDYLRQNANSHQYQYQMIHTFFLTDRDKR